MAGIASVLTVTAVYSQTPRASTSSYHLLTEAFVPGDNEKDPAYKIYKEGYALILDDKWSEAMKKLAEVKTKYPKSEYLDDAAYWSAYAQKRLDSKKGIETYEKFIKDFPGSTYIDDAVADMNDNVNIVVTPDGKNVKVRTAPRAYSYSYGSTMRASEKAMRDVELQMRRSGLRNLLRAPKAWTLFGEDDKEKKLDPQTRIKLDALRALGGSENDKEAFATLKEVALDKSQPEIMRLTAIESLEDFRKFDVLPILVDVAKTDASEEIQIVAIHTIADLGSEKNKSVDALMTLFNAYPKQREKQLQSALYAIADVGNDKAVDFLVKVATTNENYELRSDAVYYLGNIGNEKSRAALMQILKSK